MNIRTRVALAGGASAVGLIIALSTPTVAVAQNPPAVVEAQAPGLPPSPSYVWMSGHWNSEGSLWKWVAAHWELPPTRSAIWIGGHWVAAGGNWVWVNGAWNVSESPQSQAAPPEPPAPGAALEVPEPSTPPPLINGSYGPAGTVRSAQMVPVTTDYGPIEYEPAYPSYYWAGDPYWAGNPWLWGYSGAYVGFGWGPGYYNGYYGGRGRGDWDHERGGGRDHRHEGYQGGGRDRGQGGYPGGGSPVRGGNPGGRGDGQPGGHRH